VGHGQHLLEVKTFDDNANPAFDLANFDAYCLSVSQMPFRADADYLIFSYKLNNGVLSIKQIWLKKIWEITRPSQEWALNVQNKKGIIYNIRPATWYSERARFSTFNSKQEFIEALFQTQEKYKGFSYIEEYNKNVNQMFL
jgi:type II restriction enzyme